MDTGDTRPMPVARWSRVLASPAVLWLAIPVLLLPHAVSHWDGTLRFGAPRVYSGDEPHYLVILNSLLTDGDWDLRNNYAAVHDGSRQAGLIFAGTPLDHHSVWWQNGERQEWFHHFHVVGRYTQPIPLPGSDVREPFVELPRQVPGLPLLLAPVLFPFAGTDWLEPAALLTIGFCTVIGLFAFARLAASFTPDPRVAHGVALLTFFGTPLWVYGRALFPDPLLAVCLVAGACAWIRDRRPVLAGGCFAVALLLKPPIGLVALPLVAGAFADDRFARARALVVASGAGVVAVLVLDTLVYGAPFRTGPPLLFDDPLLGWRGLLVSPQGLVSTAPLAGLAVAGWPALARGSPSAVRLGIGALLWFLFIGAFKPWYAGYCYGPRYLVPVLPFVMLGLVGTWRWSEPWARVRRWILPPLAVASVLTNALAALPYWSAWQAPPLQWSRHPLVAWWGGW